MYHLKGQAADRKPSAGVQEDGSLHPGVVENHANSGREIMAERANNARDLADHPNLRLDEDKNAPDHSLPASHRHMKEVNRKVDEGEITEAPRKRSVLEQVKHAVNPDSAT